MEYFRTICRRLKKIMYCLIFCFNNLLITKLSDWRESTNSDKTSEKVLDKQPVMTLTTIEVKRFEIFLLDLNLLIARINLAPTHYFGCPRLGRTPLNRHPLTIQYVSLTRTYKLCVAK